LTIAVFKKHHDVDTCLWSVNTQMHGQTEATAKSSVLATGEQGVLTEGGL
jgi:hypothetical protein